MDIGGRDICIPTHGGPAALDMAMRAIRLHWRGAVFENAAGEDGRRRAPARYHDFSFAGVHEVLAFRDAAAAAVGLEESIPPPMIHLLSSDESLTVVVDDKPSPEIEAIVETIRHGIRVNEPLLSPALFSRAHRL